MGEEAKIYEAINYIAMTAVPVILLTGVFYSIMKALVKNIVDYILFRWDDSVGMGSRVMYNNQEAIIKSSTFRKITLITEEHLILVPMSEWNKMSIIMPIDMIRTSSKK